MRRFLNAVTNNVSVFKVGEKSKIGFFKVTHIEFPYSEDEIIHRGYMTFMDTNDGCEIDIEWYDLGRERYTVNDMSAAKVEAYLQAHPVWSGTSYGAREGECCCFW